MTMRMFTTTANTDDTQLEAALQEIPVPEALHDADWIPAAKIAHLTIHTQHTRQHIDGFGASLTEASAYHFHRTIRDPQRVLTELFSTTEGIGLSILRQPIGPTDHVIQPFRHLRRLPDSRLRSLDFSHEERHILPLVSAAQQIRSSSMPQDKDSTLNIMVAPWSAPAWMKTNHSLLGKRRFTQLTGYLSKRYYDAYARYLTAFVDLYRRHGLPVFALSVVNEPDNAQSIWPSMAMTPAQQARFIANFLAPRLQEKGFDDVRIMAWDHNYSTDHYPDGAFIRAVYEHPRAYDALAGSAWHYYGGDIRVLDRVHEQWPHKGIWITEASGGDWGPRNWDHALIAFGETFIAMLNHWAQSIVLWNLVLDEHSGPDYYYRRHLREHAQNRGLLTVNSRTGAITYNADFFAIAHFSRFIQPGSVCVGHGFTHADGCHAVSVQTPDYGTVAVVVNTTATALPVAISVDGRYINTVTLPPRSLTTLTNL